MVKTTKIHLLQFFFSKIQQTSSDMAKSFQPVVVSRSYKDWNSAGPVKVLGDLNNFAPKLFVLFFNIIQTLGILF